MRIHDSIWFDIAEFVDSRVLRILKENAAFMVDPKIVRVCDLLRELSGKPTTVNNWSWGGIYDSSGFRAIWDKTGGTLSQHRCGRGADAKVRDFTPKMVHELILDNSAKFEDAGLTTLEHLDFTPSWSHLDVRPRIKGWHPKVGILIVKP